MRLRSKTIEMLQNIDVTKLNLPYLNNLKSAAKTKNGQYNLYDYLLFIDGSVDMFNNGGLKGKFQTFEEFLTHIWGTKEKPTSG